MKFCPKCGSIMLLKKEGGNNFYVCPKCNYKEKVLGKAGISQKTKKSVKIDVVEEEHIVYPITKAECPKCGNKEAYYWTVQTRAADEGETKFFKCTKCGYTWREYD